MNLEEIIVAPHALSPDQQQLIREILTSILASQYFNRSKRYPALLEYVVHHSLEGDLEALRERAVGLEVFSRSADYDPATDSVVRMAFSEVRKRMALYFSVHPDAPVRIVLPTGSYTAEFHFRTEPANRGGELEVQEVPALLPELKSQSNGQRRWVVPAISVAAVILLLVLSGAKRLLPGPPVERFWAPLLSSRTPVIVSIGAPFALPAPQWVSAAADNAMINYLNKQPNYPVPDIAGASSISQFLASRGATPQIRMANSLELFDLNLAPAVLIGEGKNNPWGSLFTSSLRFQLQASDGGAIHWIWDKNNPAISGWKVDLRLPYDQIATDYALITREFSPATGQWWIGVGGTTGLSSIEGAHMLTEPAALKTIEASLPAGWEQKNLQVVVEFHLAGGRVAGSHVLGTYVW